MIWQIIGGAFAFACFGVGAYFCALAAEQLAESRFKNRYSRP